MRAVLAVVLSCAAAALAPAGAGAQLLPVPLAVEVRLDGGLPVGGLSRDVGPGGGFGVSAAVQVLPGVGVYGSYSRFSFSFQGANDRDAVDSGFSLGLTTGYQAPRLPFGIYVGGGVVFHEMDDGGTLVGVDDESSPGFELGAGITIDAGTRVRITPGLGFRSYEATFNAEPDASIQYFTAGVGVNVAL